MSGGLSCRNELIFLGDVVRSAPVDLGLPVFSVCFLFSSQTDFIHTIYLAMPARLWSLVLFWQRKFINFSRLPTHFPNVLGEKKMACFLWPHRRRNIARSAEFVAREADHFCRHSEKKRVPENVLNQSRRENGVKDRRVREYIGFIYHSRLPENYLNLSGSVNRDQLLKATEGWLRQTSWSVIFMHLEKKPRCGIPINRDLTCAGVSCSFRVWYPRAGRTRKSTPSSRSFLRL